MFSKTCFIVCLGIFSAKAIKVTGENTDAISDMDEIGYFKDNNQTYNSLTATEKKE